MDPITQQYVKQLRALGQHRPASFAATMQVPRARSLAGWGMWSSSRGPCAPLSG